MAAGRPAILVRAAAGPRIGFGHLVRARTLARALDADVCVSVRGTSATTRRARSLGLPIVHSVVHRALEAHGPFDLVVVDDPSRRCAREAIAAARTARARVAVIRDAGRPDVRADLIIDGSVVRRRLTDEYPIWAGPRYALLDPGIVARRCSPRVHDGGPPRVLIALGGGPRWRLSGAIGDAIADMCPGVRVRIASGLAGKATPGRRACDPVEWLGPLASLADELWSCDVAVLAGGMTVYEACALATPAVSLAIVRAQTPAVQAFAAAGATLDAGVCVAQGRRAFRRTAHRVGRLVRRLLEDRGLRQRLAYNGHLLVDGAGARRVARLLMEAACMERAA